MRHNFIKLLVYVSAIITLFCSHLLVLHYFAPFVANTILFISLRFPRFINEIICDDVDKFCMTFQGSCKQNFILMDFQWDIRGVGLARRNEWITYKQLIRNGCHCQLIRGSVFDAFVWWLFLKSSATLATYQYKMTKNFQNVPLLTQIRHIYYKNRTENRS